MTDEYLTTREVEQLVRLNRVTIYRLIRDGELPAVKIGGQWRFPRTAIESWLGGQASVHVPEPPAEPLPSQADLLSTLDLEHMVTAFKEATGLAICIADADGQPTMTCSVCHPFCRTVRSTTQGEQACAASWSRLTQVEGALLTCHAGLGYLVTPVEVAGQRLAFAVVGPFVSDETHMEQVRRMLPETAQRSDLAPEELLEHLHTIRRLPQAEAGALARLLGTVVGAMMQIVCEWNAADQRLKQIAQLVSP